MHTFCVYLIYIVNVRLQLCLTEVMLRLGGLVRGGSGGGRL